MPPRWADTHVHLERYSPAEAGRMLSEARAAGVAMMLAVSTSLESSRRTIALDGKVLKAIGVHPTRAADIDRLELADMARTAGVVAIGETGFDAAGPAWDIQTNSFAIQADAAREAGLAVVLHIDGEGAWEMFEAEGSRLDGLRVMRHYFQGGEKEIEWHAARGHYISFGRPLLRNERLQEIARMAPLGLLLIETDTYPLAGRTTTPKDVVAVGEALARLRGMKADALAAQLWTNTNAALGLSGD